MTALLRDGAGPRSSAMGGRSKKFVGDAVMAAFGIPGPRTRTDAAARGARRGSTCARPWPKLNRDLAAEYGVELQVRTGVNTGEVIAGDAGRPAGLCLGGCGQCGPPDFEQASKPGPRS